MNRRDMIIHTAFMGGVFGAGAGLKLASPKASEPKPDPEVKRLADECDKFRSTGGMPKTVVAMFLPPATMPVNVYVGRYVEFDKPPGDVQSLVNSLYDRDDTLLKKVMAELWERHRPREKEWQQVKRLLKVQPSPLPGKRLVTSRISTAKLVTDVAELFPHVVIGIANSVVGIVDEMRASVEHARQTARTINADRFFMRYTPVEIYPKFDNTMLSVYSCTTAGGNWYKS